MKQFRYGLAAGVALGAMLGFASIASAQTIGLGAEASGTLSANDPTLSESGQHFDEYTITLAQGQGVEIRMRADFDTYLYFGQGSGDEFTEITRNDDDGQSLNSRIRVAAPEAGQYTIRASSFSMDATGEYTLTTSAVTITPPPTPRPLTLGQPVTGTFTEAAPILEYSDQPYDLFTYDAREGELLIFTMNSDDMDSYIEIGRDGEYGFEPYASDDDGGEGLNSRAVFRAPEAGVYTVRAMSLNPGGTGEFTVEATRYPQPATAPRPTPIRVGSSVTGEIEDGEIVNDMLQIYDSYSLRVRAGQDVTITLRSNDFDSYLEIGELTPAGWAVAKADDDGGGGETGLDSQLTFTPSASGTVIIRAMPLGSMSTGSYTLSVE